MGYRLVDDNVNNFSTETKEVKRRNKNEINSFLFR